MFMTYGLPKNSTAYGSVRIEVYNVIIGIPATTSYRGDYSSYLVQKKMNSERQLKEYEAQQKGGIWLCHIDSDFELNEYGMPKRFSDGLYHIKENPI